MSEDCADFAAVESPAPDTKPEMLCRWLDALKWSLGPMPARLNRVEQVARERSTILREIVILADEIGIKLPLLTP